MLPLILLAALQGPAQAPVLRATLQDEAIRAGESTVLRVDVETGGERARIQVFRSLPPGLELQGTRDFDQRQFGIPGGTRRFVSREFVIRARAAGRYRIPAVDVEVGDQTYSTPSQLLTVVATAQDRRGGAGDSDGVVLRVWLDADTVFVGEQVTLEAEAMFSPDARLRLRRAPEYEAPSPSGFWIQDLPDRRRSTSRFVGQERFEVQRFGRVLFPLAPGEYEIPPARLEYEVRRGLLYAPETRELTSEPQRLVVLPVPEPRPATFTGAVGNFTARARLDPGRVPAGEAAVLTVEVEGTGNVKSLPPPALPELRGVEVFPPGEEANAEVRDGVVRGSKRFSWVLIPREPGSVEVPAIQYAFFEPESAAFRVAEVEPLILAVTAGGETATAAAVPTVRYLAPEPAAGDPFGWVRSPWFAALQLLPLAVLVAVFGWRRGAERDTGSLRRLRRERRRRIITLEDQVAADPARLADAEAFTHDWLQRRLGLPGGAARGPAAWTAAGAPADRAAALGAHLERIAVARYAPSAPDPETRRGLIRQLGRLLEHVDREATPHRRRGAWGPTAATIAMALLVAPPVLGASVQDRSTGGDGPTATFDAGVRAFDEERFETARDAFERYVTDRPADPAGWYNLGTAAFRSGDRGRAIWAWLKVPRLDPRNRDVRHNLRVAGVSPELVARASPPLPLRSTELLLAASALWMVSALAGALWLLRRRRVAGTTAAASFLLALAAAAAGWASTRVPPTVIVVTDAPLRAGPNLRADPLDDLEPGAGLTPVERRDGWIRVRTPAGGEGWIDETATARL